MPNRSQKRNNVVAGLFVSGAIVAGMVAIIVLSGASFHATQRMKVSFSIEQGAAGLQPGSQITLGGLNVGSVRKVSIETNEATGAPTKLIADVRVRASVKLYSDAQVELILPLLGGTSALNITSVGVGPDDLSEGDILEAYIAPPSFLANAGYGPEQANQVRAIIENVHALTEQVDSFSIAADPELREQIETLGRIMANAESITADVAAIYPQWRDNVSQTLENTETASGQFESVTTKLDDGARDAGLLVNEARATLADNRDGLDAIVANTESATEKLDRETIENINETLNTLDTDLEQVMAWLREGWPSIRKIIANMRLASDQIKLTMVEVRRSPWRLLYQPVKKELENELLYDSARTYAEAVGDLRAASEALKILEAAAQGGLTTRIAPEQIKRISAELDDAFERYNKAETEFLTKLIERQSSEK